MNPEYKTLLGALRSLVLAVKKQTPANPTLLRRKKNPMVYLLVDHDSYAFAPNCADFNSWEIAVRLTPLDVARLATVLQIDLFREENNAGTT